MSKRPEIVISSRDAERLEDLIDSLSRNAFPGKPDLENELARARIVEPDEVPPDVVTMNSTVRFRVEGTEEEFTLTLVYPKDADPSGQTISILAPVGSALLGLSQGEEIDWPRAGGGEHRVRIEEIVYQPERSGEHHR
ncbi:MAG: nucleoside diphosphate kinase regulator [Halorhodospira halophila]|uniref:nucleoside diphosphate kinase regulator n=1 Tax=Halorhodospira TaxID=85108 RepID=UPI001912124E|nr:MULTISPECIES: nucleoside diphosphate kinase regulator [Halorhodospira]MBK5937103.1 nucleoside diphosphate kinase regulator [Halorhodospira halophila]MBK5943193.1 nucleoside diphosphate kinase regulator [Halorhodospira halophila]MCC3751412.1 nucleoside diphosphate kinase regulator [Halorhodospira halophila]MCG5528705.1 nucleoside diphosphate kinase regulator [Halorhodospira halophila]MCG5533898.1 nucleoside diphosphate kinase regulator [Halorhodospira sp. 9621]